MKKQSGLFDVKMGAYDGAEVCKLVGTYMLFLTSEKYNKNDFRLYCDERLWVMKNKKWPETERTEKIQKYLKKTNYI